MAKATQTFNPRVLIFAAVIVVAAGILLVTVNRLGRPAEAPPPDPVEDAEAGDEILPAPALPDQTPTMTLQLFLVDRSGRGLRTQTERVEEPPTAVDRVRVAFDRLTSTPGSPVPAGVVLREVWVANGVAYLDFAGDVRQRVAGGSLAELMFVYGIVGTLTSSVPAVSAVQFLVDGRTVESLNGHADISQPVEPLRDWVF